MEKCCYISFNRLLNVHIGGANYLYNDELPFLWNGFSVVVGHPTSVCYAVGAKAMSSIPGVAEKFQLYIIF